MSVAYHALAGPLECSWKSGNCGAFYALETIRQYDHPMDALISGSGFSYRAFYSQSCSVAYYLAQCCFDAVLFFFPSLLCLLPFPRVRFCQCALRELVQTAMAHDRNFSGSLNLLRMNLFLRRLHAVLNKYFLA